MNDRLGDISLPGTVEGDESVCDIEMGKTKFDMAELNSKVETIKANIQAIDDSTDRIVTMSGEVFLAITSDKENALDAEVKSIVSSTNNRAKQTKEMLDELKEEIKILQAERENPTTKRKKKPRIETGKPKTTDERVREHFYNTLTTKFIKSVKYYQEAQTQYKNDIKKKMKRQVQTVKPDVTDEEVDMIMTNEGGRDALYREQVLGVSDQIKTTYAKVAGKYQDVLVLEQSVAELHEMMLSFALLTEQQGELLDDIEFQVKSAADHVEDGNVDVYRAIEYQKKVRKKQCIIILIVAIVATVVAVPIIKNFN